MIKDYFRQTQYFRLLNTMVITWKILMRYT